MRSGTYFDPGARWPGPGTARGPRTTAWTAAAGGARSNRWSSTCRARAPTRGLAAGARSSLATAGPCRAQKARCGKRHGPKLISVVSRSRLELGGGVCSGVPDRTLVRRVRVIAQVQSPHIPSSSLDRSAEGCSVVSVSQRQRKVGHGGDPHAARVMKVVPRDGDWPVVDSTAVAELVGAPTGHMVAT